MSRCKLMTTTAAVTCETCEICAMRQERGKLPDVRQRKHLQGGTCSWVGGGHHSALEHTHRCLKNPHTEQRLHEAGARQRSVHTDNIQIF